MLEQIKQDAEDINPRTKTGFDTFKVIYEKSNSATNDSKLSSTYRCIMCGAKGKHCATKCFALH